MAFSDSLTNFFFSRLKKKPSPTSQKKVLYPNKILVSFLNVISSFALKMHHHLLLIVASCLSLATSQYCGKFPSCTRVTGVRCYHATEDCPTCYYVSTNPICPYCIDDVQLNGESTCPKSNPQKTNFLEYCGESKTALKSKIAPSLITSVASSAASSAAISVATPDASSIAAPIPDSTPPPPVTATPPTSTITVPTITTIPITSGSKTVPTVRPDATTQDVDEESSTVIFWVLFGVGSFAVGVVVLFLIQKRTSTKNGYKIEKDFSDLKSSFFFRPTNVSDIILTPTRISKPYSIDSYASGLSMLSMSTDATNDSIGSNMSFKTAGSFERASFFLDEDIYGSQFDRNSEVLTSTNKADPIVKQSERNTEITTQSEGSTKNTSQSEGSTKNCLMMM